MYSTSTKVSPLLFFETFLKKGSVLEYKKQFYHYSINHSFVSNENEGYIEYIKDFYEDSEEVVPVKIKFKDRLRELIQLQYNISIRLSDERVNEIKNTEPNAKIYVNRQIQIMSTLRNELIFELEERDVFIDILDRLDGYFSNQLDLEKSELHITYIDSEIPGKTFFDLKKEFKAIHIRKII